MRVVQPSTKNVEQVVLLVLCPEPSRADRPIVVWAGLACCVPGLEYIHRRVSGWEVRFANDPMALDHGASRRHGRLLVLGREYVAAQIRLEAFKDCQRLALRMQNFVDLTIVALDRRDRNPRRFLRYRRLVQDGPNPDRGGRQSRRGRRYADVA